MKDEIDLPWDEEVSILSPAASFQESDECLMLRAKALASLEAFLSSRDGVTTEDFGKN